MAEHILNALHKGVALNEQQGHEFGLVRTARREFGKVLVLAEELGCQRIDIVDFGHRDDGKAPQVGVNDERLRIGVADDADARGASLETAERALELGTEVRVFKVVYGTCETAFAAVIHCHTATARAEVRVIIRSVEDIGHAVVPRHSAKEAAHVCEVENE